MSITDEIMNKAPDGIAKASDMTLKVAKEAYTGTKEGVKVAGKAVKGICLILGKGVGFSTAIVMKAVKEVAFQKTGDIKFSKNNIDIAKLRKTGHVHRVDENILAEVMGCFDEQCKKHGIKYSAMKDTRGEGEPSYMVFFEGKDSNLIMSALQETWKDYEHKQEEEKNGHSKGKNKAIEPEKRESVKAKLAFFRDRVAARDAELDAVEKHRQRSEPQR